MGRDPAHAKDIGFEKITAFLRERPLGSTILMRRAPRTAYDEKRDAATVRPSSARNALAAKEARDSPRAACGRRQIAPMRCARSLAGGRSSKDIETEDAQEFSGCLHAPTTRRAPTLFTDKHEPGRCLRARRAGACGLRQGPCRGGAQAANASKLPTRCRRRCAPSRLYLRAHPGTRRKTNAGAASPVAARATEALIDTTSGGPARYRAQLLELDDARTAYSIVSQRDAARRISNRRDFTAAGSLALLKDPAAAARHLRHHKLSPPTSIARGHYWHGRALEAAGDRVAALPNTTRRAPRLCLLRPDAPPHRTRDLPCRSAGAEPAARADSSPGTGARHPAAYAAGGQTLPLHALDLNERPATSRLQRCSPSCRNRRRSPFLVFVAKAHSAAGCRSTHTPSHFRHAGVQAGRPAIASGWSTPSRARKRLQPQGRLSGRCARAMKVSRAPARPSPRIRVTFDAKKLIGDPAFNLQIAAAELGDLLEVYRGSYILAFAAYNAGRSRVAEWIGRYGDPRDAKVDPIDWVERIPFSETRNYVQRIMENVQVYKARFGKNGAMIDADLARGRIN